MSGTMTKTEKRTTPGVWESSAPCGFDAGDANLRRFVGNDPTNAVDPSGLLTIIIHGVNDTGETWAHGLRKSLQKAWPVTVQPA
jgi:hypothetical protein